MKMSGLMGCTPVDLGPIDYQVLCVHACVCMCVRV